MHLVLQQFQIAAPLFAMVLIGYLLARLPRWPPRLSALLSRFVFTIAIPALLFRLMGGLATLPAVDARLLIAYFGGCLAVFAIARLWGKSAFGLDGVSQSVFALGGIFSNNVLLGVPLARVALGEAAMPAVALIIVFNSLLLWMLVTVSVEWARHGDVSLRGFGQTLRSVLKNPVIAAIWAGAAYAMLFGSLPPLIDTPVWLVGETATPLALLVLGMGLAEYGLSDGWRAGVAITALKLVGQPLAVLVLARLIGLPSIETQAALLLAALPVGINVVLMSREFRVMQSAVATGTVLSTAFAALTTPLVLALMV